MPKVKLSISKDIRAFDARLSGPVVNCLPTDPNTPNHEDFLVLGASLLAGCQVGAWAYAFDRKAAESTLNLTFGDGTQRQKYSTTSVKVRKQTGKGDDTLISEEPVDTLPPDQFGNVIDFGGRGLRKLGDTFFYLTSLGLFQLLPTESTWMMCSDSKADSTDRIDDVARYFAHGVAAAPTAINDIVALGPDASVHGYLVATDNGMFALQIDGRFAWTALPELYGRCVLAAIQFDPGSKSRFLAITEDGLYECMVDLSSGQRRSQQVAITTPGKTIDIRGVVGPIRQVAFNEQTSELLLVGSTMALVSITPASRASFQLKARRRLSKVSTFGLDSISRSGQKAIFLRNGTIAFADTRSIAILSARTLRPIWEIDLDVAEEPYLDQIIVSVSELWPNMIAVGTSQGGVQVVCLEPLFEKNREVPPVNKVSVRCVWSRDAPLLIDTALISGPVLLCGPGDYIVDNPNPDCSEDDASEKATIKFFLDLAAAAGSAAAGALPVTLAALYDAMVQLLIIGGLHDHFSAWIAKAFYGYSGKANCIILPSGPMLPTDTLVTLFPRVVEGSFSGDPNYVQNGLSGFQVDAACGWARFERIPNDSGSITMGSAGAFDVIFVRFKNWSHDRTRAVKLDLLVSRNQQVGRTTVIVP